MCYPISGFEFPVSASDFQIRRPIFNQKTYPISGKSVNLWMKDAQIDICFELQAKNDFSFQKPSCAFFYFIVLSCTIMDKSTMLDLSFE